MALTAVPSSNLNTYLGANPGVERIYDNVQANLPGITVPQIEMALWNTIVEFCQKSTYFRLDINWTMAESVSSIDFNPIDANTLVVWVLKVTGLAYFHIDPPGRLVDDQPPLASRTGMVTVATQPARFSNDLPPILFTNWFETILDGTLYRLYGQPAKPWTSTQLAAYHGRRYRSGLVSARADANRKHHGDGAGWVFPRFANGRRR